MKTKNFPTKKLARQLRAQGKNPEDHPDLMAAARDKRTKKDRRDRGKKNA